MINSSSSLDDYRVVISKKEGELKYGIIQDSTGKMVVDNNYFLIDEIPNHQDLSMKNALVVNRLFETEDDHDNDEAYYCYINEEGVYISKSKYSRLHYFYKDRTYCKVNNLDCIMDIKENIQFGPVEDIYELQTEFEEPDENRQLFRCDDIIRGDFNQKFDSFGYIKDTKDINSKIKEWFNTNFWDVNDEMVDWDNYCSIYLDEIKHYQYDIGLSLVLDKGKLGYMNRYYYLVGDFFDYWYTDKDKFDAHFHLPEAVDVIGLNGKSYIIKFTGNFVEEIFTKPELFLEYQPIKDHFNKEFHVEPGNGNAFPERTYWKVDKYYIDILKDNEIYKNPDFICTEEWLNEKINSKELLDLVIAHFPFYSPSCESRDIVKNEWVKSHNKLFGNIYSSYEILEELKEKEDQ